MGVWIPIKKYKEEQDMYYYGLYSSDGKKIIMHMRISAKQRLISYSTNPNFDADIYDIDVNDPNATIYPIPLIDYAIILKFFYEGI